MAEIIKIPPGMHLDFRRHDDNGANVVEAYVARLGPLGGYLGQRFKGYETKAELHLLTLKFKNLSTLLLFIKNIVIYL